MTLSLTDEKKNKIKTILTGCLGNCKISLKGISKDLREYCCKFPAVTYGPLDYRDLEREKVTGLQYCEGNFEGKISLLKQ